MKVELKKILVGYQPGELAETVLKHAAELGRHFQSQVVVLHAIESAGWLSHLPPSSETFAGAPTEEAQATYARTEADRLLKAVGLQARILIRTGEPFLQIIQAARDEKADLIVIGTHGRNILAQVLMGSTAEKIVRTAPCPVLTVRAGQHEFVAP